MSSSLNELECPVIKEFLSESLGESGKSLFLGLCALISQQEKHNSQIMYFFRGESMSGKTIARRIIQDFVGEESYTSLRLGKSRRIKTNEWRKKELKRSSVNFLGDVSKTSKFDIPFLKSLLAGEFEVQPVVIACGIEVPDEFKTPSMSSRIKMFNFKHSKTYLNKLEEEKINLWDLSDEIIGFKNLVSREGVPMIGSLL